MQSLREFNNANDIIIAAHRGDSYNAPENTISAFSRAIDAGADMIETDIYFSSDKRIVIHHNSLVNSDSGKKSIGEMNFDDLKKLDVGEWFSPEFKGERIPELAELFQLMKGKIYLNLEIKHQADINSAEYLDILMNEIYKAGVQDQIMLASFCYDMLGLIKQKYPEMPIAGIRIPQHPIPPSELQSMIGIDAYICSLSGITKAVTEDTIKCNMVLGAYSIDNEKHFQKALRYKIKAMGSNRPADIIALARKYHQDNSKS